MREWTEEDEDRFRVDERQRKTDMIDKIMADAQKRYDKAEESYQSTGSLTSYRSMDRWRDLIEVCSMAKSSLDQTCFRCEQRRKNGKATIEELKGRKACGMETVSIDEAIELIGNAAS